MEFLSGDHLIGKNSHHYITSFTRRTQMCNLIVILYIHKFQGSYLANF